MHAQLVSLRRRCCIYGVPSCEFGGARSVEGECGPDGKIATLRKTMLDDSMKGVKMSELTNFVQEAATIDLRQIDNGRSFVISWPAYNRYV